MLDILTVTIYGIIAIQFGLAAGNYRTRNRKAVRAFGLMIFIFVLCAVSGYLDNVLLMPEWLHVSANGALILFSVWFVVRNQALVIIQALRDD